MPLVDYKAKYLDLKTKYMETVDLAWRLGFEQGAQQAQMDQAQQQQAQNDAMAQVANGQPQPGEGQPGEEQNEEQQNPSQNPNEDELGQHIQKLEGMLGKSEITALELQDLKKTLNDIRSLQVQINLTKSINSIKSIKMPDMKKSLNLSPKVKANLPVKAQQNLSLQEDIVANVFKKWNGEKSSAIDGIAALVGVEGLLKKE